MRLWSSGRERRRGEVRGGDAAGPRELGRTTGRRVARGPRVATTLEGRKMQEQVARLLPKREGHFVYESGHHGQVWLDLELLFRRPDRVRPLAEGLADRLRRTRQLAADQKAPATLDQAPAGTRGYTVDIILQGADETPFFED